MHVKLTDRLGRNSKCVLLLKLFVLFTLVQAYVIFLTEMGGGWVERHLPTMTQHILSLLSHPKATATHIDAVYSRKCVSFVLRSVFGQLLGESAQFIAAKHLCQLIIQTTGTSSRGQRSEVMGREAEDGNAGGGNGEREGRDRSSSHLQTQQQQQQHVVICAILEVGALVFNLNTAALPLVASDGVMAGGRGHEDDPAPSSKQQQPPLFAALNSILMLPHLAPRLAAAWCLHCVSLALPSQLCYLITHCLDQLRDPKKQTQVLGGGGGGGAELEITADHRPPKWQNDRPSSYLLGHESHRLSIVP